MTTQYLNEITVILLTQDIHIFLILFTHFIFANNGDKILLWLI